MSHWPWLSPPWPNGRGCVGDDEDRRVSNPQRQ